MKKANPVILYPLRQVGLRHRILIPTRGGSSPSGGANWQCVVKHI